MPKWPHCPDGCGPLEPDFQREREDDVKNAFTCPECGYETEEER